MYTLVRPSARKRDRKTAARNIIFIRSRGTASWRDELCSPTRALRLSANRSFSRDCQDYRALLSTIMNRSRMETNNASLNASLSFSLSLYLFLFHPLLYLSLSFAHFFILFFTNIFFMKNTNIFWGCSIFLCDAMRFASKSLRRAATNFFGGTV